jgi:predicted acylesterase/phospholipase RssA
LIDGGVVSTLPIEPALAQGAGEIIALDLADPRQSPPAEAHGFGPFLGKLMGTIEQRQIEVEMALAAARGVPVWRIPLQSEKPVALWDFSRTDELIGQGYEMTRQEIAHAQPRRMSGLRTWLARLGKLRQGT